MTVINWKVNGQKGSCRLQKINEITVTLDSEVIKEARAELKVPVGKKMFFNGFQTWTWCPEYKPTDIERGLNRASAKMIRECGSDRYGDYHFRTYSENPGQFHGYSYCYFRDGNDYRLFASLSEEEGYTVFSYDCARETLTVERDCIGVRRNGSFRAFNFVCLEGREDEVFDEWFALLGIKPRTKEKLFGYSSWYNRYEDINIQTIEADLEGCRRIMQPGDLFQIDDGWEPAVGDWLEPDPVKFPQGMAEICQKIHDCGFKSGLWLAPFGAAEKSRLFKEHPDWLIKDDNGYCSGGANWGGFYGLNLENEEVRAYLKKVFDRVFNEWKFDLVKLDFLYVSCMYNDEKSSRAEKMIRAMKWIRELCGDRLILGCGVPLMPAFGLVDYCRIGPDVSLDWDDKPFMKKMHRERISTLHSTDNSICRRQLNGRAFLNDPDVFFLRDDNLYLSERQKEYLYTVNGLFSGILLTSDNPGSYDEARISKLAAVRKLMKATDIKVTDRQISCLSEGVKHSVERKRKM